MDLNHPLWVWLVISIFGAPAALMILWIMSYIMVRGLGWFISRLGIRY